MNAPRHIQFALWLFGLAGALLFTALLAREGVAAVGSAVATAGWGIAAVAAYHIVPLTLDAISWWVLFPKADRPLLHRLLWMRWIGELVGALVPSAQVGGDIVRARLAAICAVPLRIAAGTVLVDVTLGIFTQIAFTLLGLAMLIGATGRTNFAWPILLASVTAILAIVGFYIVQRLGIFRIVGILISKLAKSPDWHSLVRDGTVLDQAVRALYARRPHVAACCAVTMASLVLGSGEIWIALWAMGVRATFVQAIILQSVALAIRSAFFPIPGALGVQEGGYVFVAKLLGISGEMGLALSLIARFRDLTTGIPALVAWQFLEGRRLLRARLSVASR